MLRAAVHATPVIWSVAYLAEATVGDGTHATRLILGPGIYTRQSGVQLFFKSFAQIDGQGASTIIQGDIRLLPSSRLAK